MTVLRRPAVAAVAALCAMALAACGARTGLEGPELPARDAGTDGPLCVPRAPPVEVCNGLDDDCNGRVDDGLGLAALGEPIVLRDTEGDTGPCTSCRWAWRPLLAPQAGGGYLALWYLGIYGGAERPDIFARALDAHGNPTSPVRVIGQDVVLSHTALAPGPLPDGDTLVGACFRDGNRDVGGWERVHPDGTVTSVRGAATTNCHGPVMRLGDRVVSTWSTVGQFGIDTSRLDGSLVDTHTLDIPSLALSVGGGFGDHLGFWMIAVPGGVRTQSFLAIDASGEPRGAPRTLALDYESYPRLVGLSDGYLVVLPGQRSSPARHVRLTLEGEPVGVLTPFPDGHTLADSSLGDAFVHHPTEPVVVAVWQDVTTMPRGAMHVDVMDENAAVLASWSGPTPGSGYFVSPSVTFAAGRLLVAWHDTAGDQTPNHVYVREFGCAP